MLQTLPHTPRRSYPHPAPLTGRAKTRKLPYRKRCNSRGGCISTYGLGVQHFEKCYTDVTRMLHFLIVQYQRDNSQVQHCNTFRHFCLVCVRTRMHPHAHEEVIIRYNRYNVALNMQLPDFIAKNICNRNVTKTAMLHLCVKSLISLINPYKPFVYRGLMA